jgi:pimeloyl-ACP methyl ester carboxylesterase
MSNEEYRNISYDQWIEGGSYYDQDGQSVFFREKRNSGELLICIHGFPTSSYDYHKLWEPLTERFHVATYDLVGYGASAKPQNIDYTTFLQADVLEGLANHLRTRRIHILSHDFGNTITLELIARIAEGRAALEIGSICMMNGALFPETHRPIFAQKLLISPAGAMFGSLIPDRIFKNNLSKVFGPKTRPTEDELDVFVRAFKQNGGKRIAHKLIRYMTERETYRQRWLDALRNISVPFRFINGLADPVSGEHLVKRFRELVPEQHDIVEMRDIGHFPHIEAPEEVSEHIVSFFSDTIASESLG